MVGEISQGNQVNQIWASEASPFGEIRDYKNITRLGARREFLSKFCWMGIFIEIKPLLCGAKKFFIEILAERPRGATNPNKK